MTYFCDFVFSCLTMLIMAKEHL